MYSFLIIVFLYPLSLDSFQQILENEPDFVLFTEKPSEYPGSRFDIFEYYKLNDKRIMIRYSISDLDPLKINLSIKNVLIKENFEQKLYFYINDLEKDQEVVIKRFYTGLFLLKLKGSTKTYVGVNMHLLQDDKYEEAKKYNTVNGFVELVEKLMNNSEEISNYRRYTVEDIRSVLIKKFLKYADGDYDERIRGISVDILCYLGYWDNKYLKDSSKYVKIKYLSNAKEYNRADLEDILIQSMNDEDIDIVSLSLIMVKNLSSSGKTERLKKAITEINKKYKQDRRRSKYLDMFTKTKEYPLFEVTNIILEHWDDKCEKF